jgi:hypothetical protein
MSGRGGCLTSSCLQFAAIDSELNAHANVKYHFKFKSPFSAAFLDVGAFLQCRILNLFRKLNFIENITEREVVLSNTACSLKTPTVAQESATVCRTGHSPVR